MSLIEEFVTDYVRMVKTAVPDGESGHIVSWTEGKSFRAALVQKSFTEQTVAEREKVSTTYTVTVDRSVELKYHDVFKRLSDGQMFRVISKPIKTPPCATFQFAQVTAGEWTLT